MTCKSNTNILNYQIMEQKIASLQHQGNRFQLVRLNTIGSDGIETDIYKYQIKINRHVKLTTFLEYEARKMFAMYIQNEILQLKIY